jgi:hypothetical protein
MRMFSEEASEVGGEHGDGIASTIPENDGLKNIKRMLDLGTGMRHDSIRIWRFSKTRPQS